MEMRKLILGAMVASALVATSASKPVHSAEIYVEIAPPAARYEAIPSARPGYVWAPGYWAYQGRNHVGVRGHWVRERPGYAYYAPEWKYSDGRWRFHDERWDRGERHAFRDRDHDGVPNRVDRDRDGDGVPNRYDRAPDNPYRR